MSFFELLRTRIDRLRGETRARKAEQAGECGDDDILLHGYFLRSYLASSNEPTALSAERGPYVFIHDLSLDRDRVREYRSDGLVPRSHPWGGGRQLSDLKGFLFGRAPTLCHTCVLGQTSLSLPEPGHGGWRVKVLVADDHPLIREALRHVVRESTVTLRCWRRQMARG